MIKFSDWFDKKYTREASAKYLRLGEGEPLEDHTVGPQDNGSDKDW